jgi:sulfate permease, SulP family
MRKVDSLAFLATATAVLLVNAVLAVAIGCSFYLLNYLYQRLKKPFPLETESSVSSASPLRG